MVDQECVIAPMAATVRIQVDTDQFRQLLVTSIGLQLAFVASTEVALELVTCKAARDAILGIADR
jgi:hypothetical protein